MKNDQKQATRLKALRENADLSQREAAEALGIAVLTYQRYEYGEREIPSGIVVKMAELFGVSCDCVLGITEGVEYEVHFSNADAISHMDKTEYHIFRACKLLTEKGKELLLEIAEALLSSNKYRDE